MENRKITMTKSLLQQALVELLEEKHLSSITVTALCAKADVNRSTFYAHYASLDAVLDDVETEFLSHVSYITGIQDRRQHWQQMYEYMRYIQRHKSTFLVLLQNGRLVDKVSETSVELYRQKLVSDRGESEEEFKLLLQYHVAGTYQMISYWIQHEELYSIEHVFIHVFPSPHTDVRKLCREFARQIVAAQRPATS